jgi:large subunit ribosomal protein L10
MRQEKQYLLDEVKGHMDQFSTFVLMSYTGLSANTFNDFRRDIASKGGNFEVVRKRVLVKAATAAGIDLSLEELPGHIGLVFAGKEPIEMTKFVFKFSQDNESRVKVVGGRIDGRLYSGPDVEKLSKLPTLDVMRAELLAVLEAPMSQTLAVMESLLTSVVYCLDNKSKQ